MQDKQQTLLLCVLVFVCALVGFVLNIRAGVYYNKQGDSKYLH